MKRATPHCTNFDSVKGKVVVVSGGANGIGAATVERLFNNQAHVVFGDMDEDAAMGGIKRLEAGKSEGGKVTFVKGNVTEHADVYKLFKTAYDKYGRIDHAFEIVGLLEKESCFDPELTIESVEHAEETTASLDLDMEDTAVFARIAIVFLRSNKRRKDNRSLTLTSNAACIGESPGEYVNHISMHSTIGLMRSMRKTIYKRDGIRVNCICPEMTELLMSPSVVDTIRQKEHAQTADDCARFYLGVANNPSMDGKSIYVEGGKGWEFEDELPKLMTKSLGTESSGMLRENMKAMGQVPYP
jgi:NAD(P)-dependent dehydrogenase (short-subunit alcohol dehydrogenase family)